MKQIYHSLKGLFVGGLLFVGMIVTEACNETSQLQTTEKEVVKHWFASYDFFSATSYQAVFKQYLENNQDTNFKWYFLLNQYYQNQDNLPFWTKDGYQDIYIDTFTQHLQKVEEHGFSNQLFHYADIVGKIDSIKQFFNKDANALYSALCALEWELSKAYIQYVNMLQFGIVNPKQANGGKWFYKTLSADSVSVTRALNQMEMLPDFLRQIQPGHFQYIILQKELKKYLLVKDSILEKIDLIALDSGQNHAQVQKIAQRLTFFHLLETNQHSDTLNENILNALNCFRNLHAIPPSDKLDKETVDALNRPVEYYIDKIRVNLERLRWKTQNPKSYTYVAVNIPDFNLYAYLNDELKAKMKICCGSTEKLPWQIKQRTVGNLILSALQESPMLYGEINRLVIFPQWHVPESITEKEYFHRLAANPQEFLKKEAMYLTSKGKFVSPDSLNWSQMNAQSFPYKLVQRAGKYSSLGIIKFHFPNSQSVYLHDTPSKRMFKYRNRAVSHGCIRLEEPLKLAKIIFELNELSDERKEQILIDLDEKPTTPEGQKYLERKRKIEANASPPPAGQPQSSKRTSYVDLNTVMPVYIEYYTCFADENGNVNYRNDVYFKDRNVLYLLNLSKEQENKESAKGK